MRSIRFVIIAAIFLGASALAGPRPGPPAGEECPERRLEESPEGCTVVMVGKNASVDGSTLTTHTADCAYCDWTWRHVPAADHKPGSKRKIYHFSQFKTWPPSEGLKWDLYLKDETGLEIPQVPHTYAFHHGLFGYMNEHQLAIGESTIFNVPKIANPTPSGILDITMLTLIAMERCRTARDAVRLIGSLAETYGYGYHDGGEMLSLSDPNEVWDFEIMPVGPLWTPASGKPGAVWCAQRVPDDHVSVCPNEARIGEIDLSRPDFFMASSNVVSFAAEKGLYDPLSGKPFNWKKAYSPVEGSAKSSEGKTARLWRFFNIVAPSLNLGPETPNMELPFSVKPDRKISLQDVMAITRDKCRGTPFDPAGGIRGGPFSNPNYSGTTRTIGVNRAEYTTITQCRGWLPDPIGGVVWIAWGAQDTSCYMPFYAGASEIPKSFGIGDHWVFNRDSARWAFDYVDFHAQVVYSFAIQDIQAAREKWETAALARAPEIEKQALDLFRKSPASAARFLTGYCLNNADNIINAWWELGDSLLVRYNHLYFYNVETRAYDRNRPPLPEFWKRAAKAYDILMGEK